MLISLHTIGRVSIISTLIFPKNQADADSLRLGLDGSHRAAVIHLHLRTAISQAHNGVKHQEALR